MRFSSSFFVALLVACSSDLPSSGSELPAPTDPGAEVGAAPLQEDVLLRAGQYDVILDGTPVNQCGLLAEQLAPQAGILEPLDGDRFVWDGAECTVWGASDYTCYLTYSQEMVAPDVELTTTRSAVGFIVDTETLEEEHHVTIDCGGPGCDDFGAYVGANFPCEIVMETTPTWRSE